jgi:signal transduction histidine kinase
MDQTLLERMLEISRQMAETRALAPLLDYAMGEAIDLVGAERGYVVLLRPDNTLDFKVQRGQDGGDLHDGVDQISHSILTEVIETGKPLVVRDAANDTKFERSKSVMLLRIRSVMCVPLIARGETIGAIYVENRSIKGRFSEESLPPLIFFANQAAVLIENAALNDELESRVAQRTHELEGAMAQLERSWAETVEANRLRTTLLSNVAHDLRAPLAIVVGSLSLMLDGTLGELQPEQAEWINKSLEATNFVLRLTNDVFDLAKMEIGGLQLYPQQVNLSDFLTEIYDVGKGLPRLDGVELHLEIRNELPTVMLDPVRIRQVLLNLLSNAFKFTSQGAVTLHAVYLAPTDEILLGVADTGEGIPPEKIPMLFKRFQQVDTDTKRRRSGTGLGLAISNDLVKMHHGEIWVESTPGIGSDFQFRLPVNGTFEESAVENA